MSFENYLPLLLKEVRKTEQITEEARRSKREAQDWKEDARFFIQKLEEARMEIKGLRKQLQEREEAGDREPSTGNIDLNSTELEATGGKKTSGSWARRILRLFLRCV